MAISIATKLNRVKPKYLVMQQQRIKELEEKGNSIINLGRGNPDRQTFPEIVTHTQERITDPVNHGYPPYGGKRQLKNSIQQFYFKEYNVLLEQKEVAISNGSAVALSSLAQVLLNPGDRAMIPDPAFFGYESAVRLAEASPYFLPLKEENDFLIEYDQIPEEVSRKAKVLFLNYPNNPTGAAATKAFFEETVRYAKRYDIAVVHDFAYANSYFSQERPLSFLEIEGAKEVGVETYTMSKTYNMAGWRSAFTLGNASIIAALTTYFQNALGGVPGIVQDATSFALDTQAVERERLRALYDQRKRVATGLLDQLGWHYHKPQGSFFIWVKVPSQHSSIEFAHRLLEEAYVAAVPGSIYGENGEGFIRLSLTVEEKTLREAFKRIEKTTAKGILE